MTKDERFKKAVIKHIKGMPNAEALKDSSRWFSAEVKTNAGALLVILHEPQPRQNLYSVFMRFINPKCASIRTNCNIHSGKWNLHSTDADDALHSFKKRMERTTKGDLE